MNAPKLRFKEFTDDWKSDKISNLTTYVDYRGKTPIKTETGIFLITAKNVKKGYIDYNCSKEYVEASQYNAIMHRGLPKVGDVLVTTEAPCGNVAQIDNANVALAQRIIKYRGNDLINNDFLKYELLSDYFQTELKRVASGGTVYGVKGSTLHQMSINYCSKEEQTKIAQFLSLLDKKIELQTKKIEALKLFKKGLISKLLNEYDYEIMKIKDVLKFEQPTKYIVNSDDYINDSKAIPVLTANKAFILGYCNENNFYDKGDSIIFDDFTMDMKYTNFNYKIKSSAIKILTANDNNDLRFLYELLLSLNLKSEEHKRHYISIVQEMDVKIPSIEVQNSISSKLELVDNKILFEEKILDNLTKLKKGFMQNMFV